MTTSPILEDVAAYVDVWSSDKTANCSKPFVQQLQEMGAQVTKTFNKQVTHVVFKNGHSATWRKAKKSGVKLVSVLWVSRCYEDGVRVDEELYPALNDESNPALKNKKHRCMQPKDSPEKTPENDKRMRKKLDRMMKNLPLIQPIETEVSPIIIDEESGIVYSPALKRSDYMARRLKDMKEKHEYLSPTASQRIESCSPTGLKPSLGSTPTVLKLTYDQSDDDSSASAAEPTYSPDKGEGRTKVDAVGHDHLEQPRRKEREQSWLSPCRDVPKRIPNQSLRRPSIKDSDALKQIKSPSLKQPDFVDEKDRVEKGKKKSRPTSVGKKTAEKQTAVGSTERPHQTAGPEKPQKSIHKEKRRSQIKPLSLSPEKSEKGKLKAAKETKTRSHSDTVTSSSCRSLPAVKSGDAAVKMSKETSPPPPPPPLLPPPRLYQTPKRARQSFSALVRSFTEPRNSKHVVSSSNDGDDNVFEDYFSPANLQQKSQTPISLTLPVEEKHTFQIPFELDSVPSKKKQRRSESIASEASSKKKRKLEEGQSDKNRRQSADASIELQSHQQQDVEESRPSSESSASSVKPVDKRRRKSTVPMTNTDTTTKVEVKKKRTSISVQQATLTETKTELKTQKNSAASVLSHDSESRGNERANAAGSEESPSEGDDNLANNTSSNVQKTVNRTTAMRTLVMTSMPTEKQQTVAQVVKSLGGFYIADQVCESTTHVVSGSHRRTLNILLGIARGCWILSFEWILWCLEQRQWIPEEPYELSDQFPAAQICRLQRHLSAGEHQQDLFEDQPAMFVSQHSQPPTQSLMELIQLCGGKVCKTVRQAGICIGKYSGRRPEGSRILSEQWVLDSITHLKQLSYDNYDLEQSGEKS